MMKRSYLIATTVCLCLAACQIELPHSQAGGVQPNGSAPRDVAPSGSSNVGGALRATLDSFVLTVDEIKDLAEYVVAADGKIATDVIWTSSDDDIVSITTRGQVKALRTGATAVTATLRGNPRVSARIQVNVVEAKTVLLIKVSPSTPTLQVGDKEKFSAAVQMADGQINGNVIWNSSDDTIATVNPTTGEVSANHEGEVTIVASYAVDPLYKALAKVTIVKDRSMIPPSPSATPIMFGPSATPLPVTPTSPTPTPVPTPDTKHATISGIVYAKSDAGPDVQRLAGVTIIAKSQSANAPFDTAVISTADGVYEIKGAPTGILLELTATKAGYVEMKRTTIPLYDYANNNKIDFGGTNGGDYALMTTDQAARIAAMQAAQSQLQSKLNQELGQDKGGQVHGGLGHDGMWIRYAVDKLDATVDSEIYTFTATKTTGVQDSCCYEKRKDYNILGTYRTSNQTYTINQENFLREYMWNLLTDAPTQS